MATRNAYIPRVECGATVSARHGTRFPQVDGAASVSVKAHIFVRRPVILAVLDAYDNATASTVPIYISDTGYVSRPGDSPANTVFAQRILEAPRWQQDMFDSGRLMGRSRVGFGSAVVNNRDHGLDEWHSYVFDGRQATFYYGDKDASFPNGFLTIFDGLLAPIDMDDATISLNLRDGQEKMVVPFQQTYYTGGNVLPDGLEGLSELGSKPKPVVYGTVKNVPAVQVNSSKLIYQVNDGPVSSITVYDSGLELAGDTEVTFASTDMLFNGANGSYAVTYDSLRSQFVAVGQSDSSNHRISTSPDGLVWTLRRAASGMTNAWYDIAYDSSTGSFVAVGYEGTTPKIMSSPDGVVWTERTSAHAISAHNAVVAGPGEGTGGVTRWLAVGRWGGTIYLETSDDGGKTWTARTGVGSPGWSQAYAAEYANGIFVVGGGASPDSILITSPDAITWTERTLPANFTSLYVGGIAYSPTLDRWVVSGMDHGCIAYSDDDCVTWTYAEAPVHPVARCKVQWSSNLNQFYIPVPSVNNVPQFLVSDDGITWTDTGQLTGYYQNIYHRVAVEGQGKILLTFAASSPNGYISTALGRVYESESDLLNNSKAPAPGGYGVYLDGGYFRLGSSPAGEVTADVVEGTAASRTAAQTLLEIAQIAGFTESQWSAEDVTALDDMQPAQIGFWSGTSEWTCADVADQVMHAIGGWWGTDELGVLKMGRLDNPQPYPHKVEFTARDIDATSTGITLRRIRPSDPSSGTPRYRIAIGYSKNWTVQPTGLVGAVSAARVSELAQEYLVECKCDLSIKDTHPTSMEMRRDTLLVDEDDAAAEAARLHDIFGQRTSCLYVFSTEYDLINPIQVGTIVKLTNPYYGMSLGARFVVVKREIDISAMPPTQTLTVWHIHSGALRAVAAGATSIDAAVRVPGPVYAYARADCGATPAAALGTLEVINPSYCGELGMTGSETWATQHDAATADDWNTSSASIMDLRVSSSSTTDQWDLLYRVGYTFDLSAFTGIVLGADLQIDASGTPVANFGGSVVVCEFTPADATSMAAADYDQFGTVDYSNRVAIADISTTGYTAFTLNEAGIAEMNAAIGGNFVLGLRISWDINDSPPTWVSSQDDTVLINTLAGAAPPKLTIAYRP